MTGPLNGNGPIVSQPGPASGRLNVSSPPKGRGFHVRFSNLQNSQLLHRHCQTTAPVTTLIDWIYVSGIVIGMILLLSLAFGFIFWLGSSILALVGLTES